MRKFAVTAILAIAGLAIVVAVSGWNRRAQAQIDAQIVADTQALLEHHLASLDSDDPITHRYGAFQRWDRGEWNRPQYAFMLVNRLDVKAVAHFEIADADVSITVTAGPQRVAFTMTPSDAWISEQPDRRLEVVNGKLFVSGPDVPTQCSLQAAVTHPDFVAD